ncbi:hypothetical protein cand_022350 [Cryptosporidium andersoni]|uniref:DNA replication complex GINS protein SLD5 n=1 Tax=Cryptosporidium andersoni TaxID=117008 RepID=A0A1J4MV10_9CRYT|nr:hypothetical protein cand_022350 [Cryptosporidium andersoni]
MISDNYYGIEDDDEDIDYDYIEHTNNKWQNELIGIYPLSSVLRSYENLLMNWINESVSPELLDYDESSVKVLSYMLHYGRRNQLFCAKERTHNASNKIEYDLSDLYLYRSSYLIKMYLKQRLLKISQYPDYCIKNSKLQTDEDSNGNYNLTKEEAKFALKLSQLQWQHYNSVLSPIHSIFTNDQSISIPSPFLHRIIRFQCKKTLGRVQLSSQLDDRIEIDLAFTNQDESSNNMPDIVDISEGHIYTCRYTQVKPLLSTNSIQLWPWPPIT